MNILINFPTNIGDAVMTLPALDQLKNAYPLSEITGIVSTKTKDFLAIHPAISQTIVFNKHWPLIKKVEFIKKLYNNYPLTVDFKHSLLPWLINTKKTTPALRWPKTNQHTYQTYLQLIKKLVPQNQIATQRVNILFPQAKKTAEFNLPKAIFIAAKSLSAIKSCPIALLKKVVDQLKHEYKIVLLGQAGQEDYYQNITKNADSNIINLVGKTSLADIFIILQKYCLGLICVDSSIMHIASYLNLPIAAFFGPTDKTRYGPWSDNFIVLRNQVNCAPCGKTYCHNNQQCLDLPADKAIKAIQNLLAQKNQARQ